MPSILAPTAYRICRASWQVEFYRDIEFRCRGTPCCFLKLPCLKIFDHDKIRYLHKRNAPDVKIHTAAAILHGGMSGSSQGGRNGARDRAPRLNREAEAQF